MTDDPVHIVCHALDADAYLPPLIEQYPSATVAVYNTKSYYFPNIRAGGSVFSRTYEEPVHEGSWVVHIYSTDTEQYISMFEEKIGGPPDITCYMGDTPDADPDRRPRIVSERNLKFLSDFPDFKPSTPCTP
tara:strand:- start:11162 stop:11557 length:396 start_codon:yes stop_codon:yes gene_type:complete